MIDRRLEASDVFDGQIVRVARLHVFVQGSEDLSVEDLELADSVDHPLERNRLDNLVSTVDSLNSQDVIAKVQRLESPLLTQKRDQSASGPIQSLAEQLFHLRKELSDNLSSPE